MNDDQKSFIKDMLKSEGWKIFEAMGRESVKNYKDMATQPPQALTDSERTYFSGKAAGKEELLAEIKEKVL